MLELVFRENKGAPLSHQEMDNNLMILSGGTDVFYSDGSSSVLVFDVDFPNTVSILFDGVFVDSDGNGEFCYSSGRVEIDDSGMIVGVSSTFFNGLNFFDRTLYPDNISYNSSIKRMYLNLPNYTSFTGLVKVYTRN